MQGKIFKVGAILVFYDLFVYRFDGQVAACVIVSGSHRVGIFTGEVACNSYLPIFIFQHAWPPSLVGWIPPLFPGVKDGK